MGRREIYEEKTEKFILPILEKNRFELVDVEYVKEGSTWYLRAYIDKEGGITVDDCESVAREMNEILDREDYVEDSYVFEVSSPGLGRPLKKENRSSRDMKFWAKRSASSVWVRSAARSRKLPKRLA